MLNRSWYRFVWMLLCGSGVLSLAQEELTLRQVMEDPYWIGALPSDLHFAPDQKHLYFKIEQPIPQDAKWQRIALAGGAPEDVSGLQLAEALIGARYEVGAHTIYAIEGDFWVGKAGAQIEPLLSESARLSFLSAIDATRFVYQRDDQLFLFDLATGRQRQLSNFKLSDEAKDEKDWYVNEEKQMLGFVAELHERDDLREQAGEMKRQLGALTRPAPAYLGKGFAINSVQISPDLKYASLLLSPEKDGEPTEYAEFINKEAKVKAKPARPKVGYGPKTWKWLIVTLEDGAVQAVDLSELPEIEEDPLADLKAGLSEADQAFLPADQDGPRSVWMDQAGFPAAKNLALVTVISQDYKDRWVVLYDIEAGELKLVDHHQDEAWVGMHPRSLGVAHYRDGAAWWYNPAEQGIAWLSDASGYHHLYVHDVASGKTRDLIDGDFEVHHPYADLANKRWLLHSNKSHTGVIHYYSMPLAGGDLTQLTDGTGFHSVLPSDDGKQMVELFSTANQPPVLRVRKGDGWQTLYDGTSEKFRSFEFMMPEFVTYKNRDGQDVHARLYRPEKPNGAGVIFIHGAGYLQNAHKGWSGYYREYMFHNMLVRQGYTVLDPDYRASAGYGRDWRTAIYRHMGGNDLEDIIDGAAWMVKELDLDKERLGVYGGSYGGFLTLMALFTEPDVFQSGAALRPVTDWAYYNHWYTSRILNTPKEDPEAYRRSSPIYFADGLKGHLVIAHGMVDDNVQYQDSVRLAQKLIELRKHNWELAGYPVEPHGFKTPTGWYDEYRRIYELFERTLHP